MNRGPDSVPPQPEPFGSEARTLHLRQAADELDGRASNLIAVTVADQSARGIAWVGFHPVCGEIIGLNALLIDRALEFDEQAKEYALASARIGKPASNPFSRARADELLHFIAPRVDSAPSWIRSHPGGRRLWPSPDEQHAADLCRIENDRIGRRIELEYSRKRALFELDRELTAKAGTVPYSTERASASLSKMSDPENAPPARSRKSKGNQPSDKAWQAWRTSKFFGITKQAEIAKLMTEQGVPATQGQVSKWLKEVDKFLTAGGTAPPIFMPRVQTINPSVIDMGPRSDGRTPSQRGRSDPDAD